VYAKRSAEEPTADRRVKQAPAAKASAPQPQTPPSPIGDITAPGGVIVLGNVYGNIYVNTGQPPPGKTR
jgi:hypothetical protein